ncbi:MAG: hypothetical protein ACTS22_09795 [Phycisphaerales bacterium]
MMLTATPETADRPSPLPLHPLDHPDRDEVLGLALLEPVASDYDDDDEDEYIYDDDEDDDDDFDDDFDDDEADDEGYDDDEEDDEL